MLATGVITVVQEQRFQLMGDDGTHRHFTLAHDAPLSGQELARLQREGCRVAVRHGPAQPGHTTSPAHALHRLAPGEPMGRKGTHA